MLGVIRERATASSRGRMGGLLLRSSLRGLRDELDPEGPGGAYLLGLRKLVVVPHGRFTRVGFANAIRAAARGVDEDVVGRTFAAMEAAGALRRPPSDPVATVAGKVTRDDVFHAIRDHLADELEVDPARIALETRFREDLEADSLDLYTLVQELEDSYGVRISDEEAAKILTVGQAVDFVMAHGVAS
jgi:acyl carrier protein